MQVAVFSAKSYDRRFLDEANRGRHALTYLEARLGPETGRLAAGAQAVCVFVNDRLDEAVLAVLKEAGIRLVALRCAGFNNVDLIAARDYGIAVARVPEYSPHAVAEHTVALILALNRKIHHAYARVREGNFALDGLLGFDLNRRTIGIVGTGSIGTVFARIMAGFGCRLLAFDPYPSAECRALGVNYVELPELFAGSDIVSLHCPLTPETRHLIDANAIGRMQDGVMLINTSRGAIIDTRAAIAGLKSERIGSLGLDVYEEEADLFLEDQSQALMRDDVFARLLTFRNVLITGHQGFFTTDAMRNIAAVTLVNIETFERTGRPCHEVSPQTAATTGGARRS